MKNRFALLLAVLFCFIQAFSQKQSEEDELYRWGILASLKVDDFTAVVLPDASGGNWEFTGITPYVNHNGKNLLWVDQNGTVTKQLPLSGFAFGISKWKGYILAFYTREGVSWQYKKEVRAMFIDEKTKAIVSDRLVYTNPGRFYQQYLITNDVGGNFKYLLIRTSNLPGSFRDAFDTPKEFRNMRAITSMAALFLSSTGDPQVKELTSSAIGGACVANYANERGEIGLVTYNNGVLTAEKFGCDGQLQKNLTVSFDYDPGYPDDYDGKQGLFKPGTGDVLVFSAANPFRGNEHRRNLGTFVFDFAEGKVITIESTKLTGDYFKQMKDEPGVGNLKHFKESKNLRPDGIFYLGDTLVVSNEIRYMDDWVEHGSIISHSEGAIVTLYDRQFRFLHHFFLDRDFMTYLIVGRRFAYHIRDGKILAFGTDGKFNKHEDVCYVLDPNNFSIQKRELGESKPSSNFAVDFENAIWYGDHLVAAHYHDFGHSNITLLPTPY